jgi:long-subunit fatty acid transport protein
MTRSGGRGWIVGLLVAVAVPAAGQEERAIDHFAGVGGRAMSMGGAFVGVADDFTALFWNPAGLAQIRHREVHAAFLRNGHETDAELAGVPATADLDNTRFGSLGIVVPYPVYQGSLVFAAGLVRTKDFDWTMRQRGTEGGLAADHLFSHDGRLTLTALAAAVDVSPSVSVGLTLGLTSGEDDAVNEFTWTDPEDLFVEKRFVTRDTFHDSYSRSLYACLGGMIRAPRERPRFRLGATLTTGSTQRISYVFHGVASEYGYDRVEYDDGTLQENPRQTVRDSYRLSLPFELGLGGSVVPVDGLLLAASLHLAEWEQSQYKDSEGNDNGLRTASDFERQYRNVARYHLGVEWQVPVVALDLRAGYYRDPLPFVGPRDPKRSVGADNPEIAIEQDRRFYTLGAGLLVDEVIQVDLAWNRGRYEQTEGAQSEGGAINRVFAGVSYRF